VEKDLWPRRLPTARHGPEYVNSGFGGQCPLLGQCLLLLRVEHKPRLQGPWSHHGVWQAHEFPKLGAFHDTDEERSVSEQQVHREGKVWVLGIGIQPNYADGMNEAGLTVNLQSLYRSEYQKCDPSSKNTIFIQNLATWILTSFSTVEQVRKAVTGKRYCVMNPISDTNTNTHWAISDKDGGSIVLEYERGVPTVHNNYVGIMTNDPFYPWHVDNLNTYRWILPDEGDNKKLLLGTGDVLAGQGQVPWDQGHGFNTGGLPADASPPSRFVRMFFTRQISQVNSRPDTLDDWMKLAQGILNDIFITKGFTAPNPNGPVILESDHTSWATIRVPKTGFYAYRTYGNMQWQKVDTTKLDWTRQKTLPTSNNFQASLKDIT
ncbi:cbh, partial [Symbiodinium sp. CCMP2456]